jgi:hypothetical protein
MEIKCNCTNGNCIKSSEEVLKNLDNQYKPCVECKDFNFKKFRPISDQIDLSYINSQLGRCRCEHRHLDVVMAHVAKILIEEGISDMNLTLRKVGKPLLTPGYPINNIPYLPKRSMVILFPSINHITAERIVNEVQEVKGVLKGDIKNTIGIEDSDKDAKTYELLSGCDIRCDVINTANEPICIYKPQRKIHIEIAKPVSPKIIALEKSMTKYENPKILDCTCGPGTLGIAALKLGASKVVFNDLWYPAATTTLMNLEINNFPVLSQTDNQKGLIGIGKKFEVYCMDVRDLKNSLSEKFDIGLVDAFPGVDYSSFVNAVHKICEEVVILD